MAEPAGIGAPQDLLEHCLQMQRQHRARIEALESHLEGYGYRPLPEGHELEVEEASDIFGEQGIAQPACSAHLPLLMSIRHLHSSRQCNGQTHQRIKSACAGCIGDKCDAELQQHESSVLDNAMPQVVESQMSPSVDISSPTASQPISGTTPTISICQST